MPTVARARYLKLNIVEFMVIKSHTDWHPSGRTNV